MNELNGILIRDSGESLYDQKVVQILKKDDALALKKYYESEDGGEKFVEFFNRKINNKSNKETKESKMASNCSAKFFLKDEKWRSPEELTYESFINTIMWSLFKYRAYRCFKEMSSYGEKYFDFEVSGRVIRYFDGGKAEKPTSVWAKSRRFIDLIAENKSYDEILPWLKDSKDYWVNFFLRNSTTIPRLFGKDLTDLRSGVLQVMRNTEVKNSELVIALYKADIIDFNDVVYIVRRMNEHADYVGAGQIATHTMKSVENEELHRSYSSNQCSKELVAL